MVCIGALFQNTNFYLHKRIIIIVWVLRHSLVDVFDCSFRDDSGPTVFNIYFCSSKRRIISDEILQSKGKIEEN